MSNTTVFKTTNYKGCAIYIRLRNGNYFEYLTVILGEIYTWDNPMAVKWYRQILFSLGFLQYPFSAKEMTGLYEYYKKAAEATIDTVLAERRTVNKGKKIVRK